MYLVFILATLPSLYNRLNLITIELKRFLMEYLLFQSTFDQPNAFLWRDFLVRGTIEGWILCQRLTK